MARRLLASLLPVLLAAGCNCTDRGDLASSDGLPQVDRETIDFGKVRLNETRRMEVVVVNRGRTRLRVLAIERVDLPTSIRHAQLPQEISPDASAKLSVTFAPEAVGVVSGQLVIRTDSMDRPEVRLSFTGEGVETLVRIDPETVDFGLVEVDSRLTRMVTLYNDGDITENVQVGALIDASPHFTLGPVPGDGGVIALEPGASAEIPVVFHPAFSDRRTVVSGFDVTPCGSCAIKTVTLRGAGIEAFLDIQPKDCLDFGLVNPGSTLTKNVTVTNLGTRTLRVLEAAFTGTSGKFSLGATFPLDAAADDTVLIPVTYSPDTLAPDTDTLQVLTDDPKASSVPVCVRGTGGGPDASVQPALVDFGTVAVGVPRTRTVRVTNVGLSDGGAPAPLLVTAATVEGARFTTSFSGPLSLDIGHAGVVSVTYLPEAETTDEATLVLQTNDADAPVVRVPLTGKGRVLPPCEAVLVPAAGLSFGNVERNRQVVLPFGIRNVGAHDCIVDSLALSPGSEDAFALPAGPIDEAVLAAGDTMSLTVAFKPTAARRYTGALTFNLSDPANPARSLPLSGVSEMGCLLLAPNELDFGTVAPRCAAREKSVTIYNTCNVPVLVEDMALAESAEAFFNASGLPATFPVTMGGSNSLSFRMRYRPMEQGEHVGGLFVRSDERDEPYLLSLHGRAADGAIQTDTFFQENRPKVDLLFVIDDSGSMGDEQQALADNFKAFMAYANEQQVDYHIAVTTTDTDASGAKGRFVPLDGSRPRVLTPRTPDVEAVFAANVKVGTNGSATERGSHAAYLALAPDLLANHNQGFLRDDALLSVIIVSDEFDSSHFDVNFYHNYFINIKGARRANLFSLSVIVLKNDDRYVELARRTGGIVGDIATTTWAEDLSQLGSLAFGAKTRFFLTSTPERPDEMLTTIDGEPLNRVDGAIVNWSYDPQGNAVEFGTLSIPEPGEVLEVSYKVACGAL